MKLSAICQAIAEINHAGRPPRGVSLPARASTPGVHVLLAAACTFMLANVATQAQESPAVGALEEVIVTATRRDQSLQDVPVVVNVLSGELIEDLALTDFEQIETVVPGLSFQDRGSEGTVTSLRGISTSVTTQAPEAVVIYYNEAPIHPFLAFSSLYDIGQIEVLRGPQGTLRGQPSPAGSITVTTKRPTFDAIGGTVETILTDANRSVFRGGVNLPVSATLAVRLAGTWSKTEGPVKSATSGAEAQSETTSFRASVLWQPSEQFSVLGVYQNLESDTDSLVGVIGEGQQGWLTPNGPVVRDADSFTAVGEAVNARNFDSDYYTLLAKYQLDFGTLSYIGSYVEYAATTEANEGDGDSGNAIPGFSIPQPFYTPFETWSHELRLDGSTENGFLDYTLGAFFSGDEGYDDGQDISFANYSEGAFGAVGPDGPTTSDPAEFTFTEVVINITSDPDTGGESESYFGSLTFHLPRETDLTLGARYIKVTNDTLATLQVSLPDLERLGADPVVALVPDERNVDIDEWIWDAKLVHRLSDDVMVYGAYSRGFRGPGNNAYTTLDPALGEVEEELSDNYEIGMKGTFLDGRLRLNLAAFQQDFDGYISRTRDIPNIDITGVVTSTDITFNGDAQSRGFEADVAMAFTDNFYANLSYAYVDATFDDALVPCRDTNFDGAPDDGPLPEIDDFPAGQLAAFCSSDAAISSVPEHTASLVSEYSFPLERGDIYLRGFYSWVGDSTDLASNVDYNSHGILNLYLGARNLVDGLDVNLFVNNVFDENEITLLGAPLDPVGGFSPNYSEVQLVRPREIGVNLRYWFNGG